MFSMRPATWADARPIRALIRQAQIKPTGLDWRRFVVAVSAQGLVIGCGQVKAHRDGSQELASIAVQPEWRLRGVARATIEHLLAAHPGAMYLMCRSSLGVFYARFGFRVIEEAKMPPYFRRISRLVRLFSGQVEGSEGLLVMKREADAVS